MAIGVKCVNGIPKSREIDRGDLSSKWGEKYKLGQEFVCVWGNVMYRVEGPDDIFKLGFMFNLF